MLKGFLISEACHSLSLSLFSRCAALYSNSSAGLTQEAPSCCLAFYNFELRFLAMQNNYLTVKIIDQIQLLSLYVLFHLAETQMSFLVCEPPSHLRCKQPARLPARGFSSSWAGLFALSLRRWSRIVRACWPGPGLCEGQRPRGYNVFDILPGWESQSAADSTPDCPSCQSGPRWWASCYRWCRWSNWGGRPGPGPASPSPRLRSPGGTERTSAPKIFCGQHRNFIIGWTRSLAGLCCVRLPQLHPTFAQLKAVCTFPAR